MKFIRTIRLLIAAVLLLLEFGSLPLTAATHPGVRIKDLADIEGVRSNQLVGVGLVMGLQGTGDKGSMSLQMVQNMVRQFGLTIGQKDIKSKNVAAVTLTCELPPFVRLGQKMDVTVSTIGDAKSLQGGVLLQTPLKAANGEVYAVAQGPVLVGGFVAGGQAARVSKNITTTGRVAGGAIVEQDVKTDFVSGGTLSLLLRDPDFTTAERVASAINGKFGNVADPVDAGRVRIAIPPRFASSPTSFISRIEGMSVRPDTIARVVVNERTGTVVMGGDVKISTVAVAHGNLTVKVAEEPQVSQPEPFSGGRTTVTPRTEVETEEDQGSLIKMPASSSVDDLIDALNAVGATPRDIIAILQAVDRAGALHGTLDVM